MKVVATLTTRWGGKGYKGLPISRISAYSVDTALDTDSDQFSIDIGDPDAQLTDLLARDSEVRVTLAVSTRSDGLVPMLKGYADLIAFTHDGLLSIQGRDLSANAVDDTALPYNWTILNPAKEIETRARQHGFSNFKLVPMSFHKNFYTDGSESEWALWYRMVRKLGKWLWVDALGTLYANTLNYGSKPKYFFGEPNKLYPNRSQWIPVMQGDVRKNTQTRIGSVYVYGDTGKTNFGPVVATDDTIQDWIKKPKQIANADGKNPNPDEAMQQAKEDIFDGIVGSLEITIQISDPGFWVQQNEVAYLNLPTMNYAGEFFVVGVRAMGGDQGFIQQIRLREKKYAISKRIPKDPSLAQDNTNIYPPITSPTGFGITPYDPCYQQAAVHFHGGWDVDLFMAGLMGIGAVETGGGEPSNIANIREGDTAHEHIWYKFDPTIKPPVKGGVVEAPNARLFRYHELFANDGGNPLNPYTTRTVNADAGVGPMQLTSHDLKIQADRHFGKVDEYEGGRWEPCSNIWVAASYLLQLLQRLPQSEANFWIGISRYNNPSTNVVTPYGKRVEQIVKKIILPALVQARKDEKVKALPPNSTQTPELPGGGSILPEEGVPDAILRALNFASRQINVAPYSQPNRCSGAEFDCSSLVWASLHAGGLDDKVGLPCGGFTTFSAWNNGKGHNDQYMPVKADELLPGDMVFFDNGQGGAQPGHMGIYWDNGIMIDAHKPGTLVQSDSVSASWLTFMGGMRLRGVWPDAPSKEQATAHPSGYRDPFRDLTDLTNARIDMGADFATSDGFAPIYAIGTGHIDYMTNLWFGGGPHLGWKCIAYTLDEASGAAHRKSVYLAEYIIPTRNWQPGDIVDSDTVLAHFVPGITFEGNGIETGWAIPGTGLPVAHTNYPHTHATYFGYNFSRFLVSLNSRNFGNFDHDADDNPASGGTLKGDPLPDAWPTW